MKNKELTLLEKYVKIQTMGSTVEIPYAVKRAFPGTLRAEVLGEQISFGEDFMSIEDARDSIAWLAEQLGGTIIWSSLND